MPLPNRTALLTIVGLTLCLCGLLLIVLVSLGRWHIHVPVVANWRLEGRAFSFTEGAKEFLEEGMKHDRAGDLQLATQDYTSSLEALGAGDLKPGERKTIKELVDTRSNASAPDFLNELLCHSRVYYWPVQRIPIRVYIPSPRMRDGFSQNDRALICNCLSEWTSVLPPGRLSYRLVNDKDRADMVFTRKRDNRELGSSLLPVAHTSPVSEDALCWQVGKISKAKIFIVQPDGAVTNRNVFLHEIGHALGLAGHSCNAGDTMFPYINQYTCSLSERDRQTFRLVYETPMLEQAAEQRLHKLAALNNKYALYQEAMQLRRSAADTAANREKALALLTTAADRGLPAARFELGNLYENGEGVARDIHKAFDCWKQAADADDRDAHLALAQARDSGCGVEPDSFKAELHYRAATEMDSVPAELRYADFLCYRYGDPQSYLRAAYYYALAAESYSVESMWRLHQLHLNGYGVPVNERASRYWQDRAVATVQRCRPDDGAGFLERGKLWMSIDRFREADSDFRRAAFLSPDLRGLRLHRIQNSFLAGNHDETDALLAELLAGSPNDADAVFLKCLNDFARGDTETCASASEHVLQVIPAPDARRWYALVYGALSCRREHDSAGEARMLDSARSEWRSSQWPGPVIDYLSGGLSAEQLQSKATGDAKEAEARSVTGIARAISGDVDGATADLQWVVERGDRRFYQYSLSRQILWQIKRPGGYLHSGANSGISKRRGLSISGCPI